MHPEDRQRCIEEYLECVYSQRPFNLEYRLLRHDGAYRWFVDVGVPRYGPAGKFLGHIGSCLDITDRKRAEDALRRFPRELLNAQEAERQRIAQELHDEVGQRIVALGISINLLSQEGVQNAALQTGFGNLRQQTADIIDDISSLSQELRPVMLRVLGLTAALRGLCEELNDSDGVDIVFTQDDESPDVPWPTAIVLYRVAQEAIRNALAHSGSMRIDVAVTVSKSSLILTIADKGCGFAFHNDRTQFGLGLTGMVGTNEERRGRTEY